MTALVIRLLPVLFTTAAAIAYIASVEGDSGYVLRNSLPVLAVAGLAILTLWRGAGRWTGAGWHLPLATLGFAIPALGLSLYLHHAWANDVDGMYSEAIYPTALFRFLPLYTFVAGAIGFAIGWIAGRNVR